MRRARTTLVSALAASAITLAAPRAHAMTEGLIDLMSGNAGLAQAGLAVLLVMPIAATADLLAEVGYANAGRSHFFVFEKELDFVVKTWSPRHSLTVFVTPQVLLNTTLKNMHRLKLRAGIHQEVLFGPVTEGPRDPRGRFGMTAGLGVSGGGQFHRGGLFAAGPDFKLFYHFKAMRFTRVVLGGRLEYGNLGREVNLFTGLTLMF